MSTACTLDHVGVVGRDLDPLAATFEALGFQLTPLARHAGGRTGNRCIMLQQGYIELLATIGGGTSATIDRFLANHPGTHTLALGIADEIAVADRLARTGIAVPAATEAERAVDDADPGGARVRFRLLSPPDRPEGRYHLIRHLTPETLWQPRFLQHPNKAEALTEAILISAAPAETAAYLSRLAGRTLIPDPGGGYALPLPSGRLRVLPDATVLGAPSVPPPPCIAGLTIRTADANASLLAILRDRGLPYRTDAGVVLVEAAGVVLRFAA